MCSVSNMKLALNSFVPVQFWLHAIYTIVHQTGKFHLDQNVCEHGNRNLQTNRKDKQHVEAYNYSNLCHLWIKHKKFLIMHRYRYAHHPYLHQIIGKKEITIIVKT